MRIEFGRPGSTVAVIVAICLLAGCNNGNSGNSGGNGTGGNTPSVSVSFMRPGNTVDLANYTLAAKYDLPVRTPGGTHYNLLADEVSAVTYDKDSDTLFVVGDGGTAIVQVDKTGKLVDTMTLPPDSSKPQGTYFYDTEGLAYVGGGQLVLDEERYQQENLLTYVPDTTPDTSRLVTANVKTVKLGATIGNIGIEGVSPDPASDTATSNGYVFVKQQDPIGVFQSSLDFDAGTASNSSPTTDDASNNLFPPTTLGVDELSGIYSLSNVLTSDAPDYDHVLLLSHDRILDVDRSGNILSRKDIDVAAQNEGITMDGDHVIYTANELGGGTDHPQLWVFKPTTSSSNVGIGSNVYLTFDRPVQAGSGSVVIDNGNGDTRSIDVTDTSQVTFDGDTVIVNPASDLVPGSTYTVSAGSGVLKDASGSAIPDLSSLTADLTFSTAGDTVPPVLDSSDPTDDAANVTGSDIVLTFSEPVKAGSGQIVLHSSAGSDDRTLDVGDTTQATFTGNTVDIKPAADLKPGTNYYVTIASGAITDLAGNAYAGISDPTTLNFSTAAGGAATTLNAGDLLFMGINGSGTDAMSFVLLKGVSQGTQICFTDKNYTVGAPWPTNEAAYTWTADRDYPAGTVVTIQTSDPSADKGTVSGTGGGVSTSGETYYAFIGTIGNPDNGELTVDHFLAAINTGGSAAGDIPADVVSAGTYLHFTNDNAKYSGSFDESDLTAFAARVKDTANNWVADDSNSGFPIYTNGSEFATPLAQGDLLFMGANADGTDAIAFVLLKDVTAGTQICFSDKNYVAATMPHWPTNEAGYTWMADVDYPAGTIVTIQPKGTLTADKGSVVGVDGGLSSSGETYYAFTGTIANADTGDMVADQFLAAINISGNAAGDIPSDVTTAGTYFQFTPSDALYTGSLDRSDLAAFAANVKNLATDWTTASTGFPVTGNSLFPAAP